MKIVDKSNSKEVKTAVKTKVKPTAPTAPKTSKWGWLSSLFSRKKKDKVKTVTVGNPVQFSSVVAKNIKKPNKNLDAPVKQMQMEVKTLDSLELLKLMNRSNREIRRHSLESKKEVRKVNPFITASGMVLEK
jgi:hypothetical protein